MGQRMGRVLSCAVSRWLRSLGCCGFRGVVWVGRIFSCFFFDFFLFERTRHAASMRPPCLIYLSTSNEARPRERSDGTCFVARCLEVVAVAGMLWISRCVLGAAGFHVFFSFHFLRIYTICCKYEPALPHFPIY